mgnify:CR=1 FL=1
MAKTEFVQIRVSPEDRERIRQAAVADHLDASTWARRIILQAVEEWEASSNQSSGTNGALPAEDSVDDRTASVERTSCLD